MAGAASYPEGTAALVTDQEQRSLVKINSILAASGGGGGAVLRGTSDPVDAPSGVSNGRSAIYYNTDTGGVWLWSGTAWDPIIV